MSFQHLIRSQISKYRSLILYCMIGGGSAGVDLVIFFLLTTLASWNWLPAHTVSVTCGIVCSFFFNALLNFKKTDRLLVRFVSFFSIGLLGLVLAAAVIKLFHDVFGFSQQISKFISLIFVVVVQYALNKKISFGSLSRKETPILVTSLERSDS